jgi:hypothetical protein
MGSSGCINIIASTNIWYLWHHHNQAGGCQGQARPTNMSTCLARTPQSRASTRPSHSRIAFPHRCRAPPTSRTEDRYDLWIRGGDHVSPMHGSSTLSLFYVMLDNMYGLSLIVHPTSRLAGQR